MINVYDLSVDSISIDHLDVTWKVDDSYDHILNYEFFVERSESPEGPFQTIAGPFQDKYAFRDINIPLHSQWTHVWYRLRYTNRIAQETQYTPAARLEMPPTLEALEIIRLNYLVMREHTGVRCFLLPVRSFGFRCPECYDRVLKRKTKERCQVCYGTTYIGGYLDPILVLMQKDPNVQARQYLTTGIMENQNTTARFLAYPPIKPEDIVVTPTNQRWRIASITTVERMGSTVRQEVQMHLLGKGHPAHMLAFDPQDAKTMLGPPDRLFNNPRSAQFGDREFGDASSSNGIGGLR